jgi:putative serine protease PepD
MTATWNSEPPDAPPTRDATTPPFSPPPAPTSSWVYGAPTPPPPPPPAPPSSPRRGGGWRVVFALVAMVGLVGAGFGAATLVDDQPSTSTPTSSLATTPASLPAGPTPTVATGDEDEPIAAVAEAVSPAVVLIQTQGGLGSGFIYDGSGLIMTNAHVVEGSTAVQVRLADGTTYDGEVLGADTGTDVAVVQISPGQGLPVARLATGDARVGQTAVAIGSPFGLEQTVTAGIVSALDRGVPNDRGVVVPMIQTDAPINPGNSGGALANRSGEVFAMNTAIFSQTGENSGVGFAIPIRTAKAVADKIVNGESLARPQLGVATAEGEETETVGAYIGQVTPGSAADEAGIRAGDEIVAVDGEPVRTFTELAGRIGTYSPGDRVEVQLLRGGRTVTVDITLGAADD